MKLQINEKGSWRNMVEFPDDREKMMDVGDAAAVLGKAVGGKATFRMLDATGEVLGYLEPPLYAEWRSPHQVQS